MRTVKKWQLATFFFTLLVVVFIGLECNRSGDLFVYLQAAADLFTTKNIYTELYGDGTMLNYFGNPFLTTFLYPFHVLPLFVATTVVKLLSICCLFRIIQLTDRIVFKPHLPSNFNIIALVILCVGSFYFIYSNLHLIQLTIFILVLSLESLYQNFIKNNSKSSGFLLGAALLIKLTPIVFIPLLVVKQKWTALVSLIVTCALFIILPGLLVGFETNFTLWSNWFAALTPESIEWSLFDMNNRKNHGISALLSTLFIKDIQDNVVDLTHRRYLMNLGQETVKYLIYGFRLFFVLLTLHFLRGRQKMKPMDHWWLWSYLFLIITLFFPQQRLYNFIFLMPAIAYLTLFQLQKKLAFNRVNFSTICFLVCTITFNLDLILGSYRKFYWYHKSVTYATILLLILLIISVPNKINDVKKQIEQ